MSKEITKELEKVIDLLLDQSSNEGEEFLNSNKDIIQKFEELKQQYKSNYTFIESLRFLLLPKIAKLICVTLNITLNDDNLMIIENLFKGTYEHFFEQYIYKTEGNACSSDKVFCILGGLIFSIIHNKNIPLYFTYEGHENINKSERNEQAYWSPRTIKDTDEAFKLFNDWYYIELNQKGK